MILWISWTLGVTVVHVVCIAAYLFVGTPTSPGRLMTSFAIYGVQTTALVSPLFFSSDLGGVSQWRDVSHILLHWLVLPNALGMVLMWSRRHQLRALGYFRS